MNFYSALSNKIDKKTAKIGIVGLGYVGLPLALQFAKKKFNVIGFDIDKNKITFLKKGKSYIKHISNETLEKYKNNVNYQSNFHKINDVNVIILCLPTPLTKKFKPDLSYIVNTLKNIKNYLSRGQLIILESSTYPGSTKKLLTPYLKNFFIGKNFFLGYSPEREDPNNKKFNLENIPKVCSGYSKNCLNITKKLYLKVIKKVVGVSNLETAEFVKLYENIYRSVNIGLVNEMKMISNKLNLNIYEIIKAAKTKPFGFQAFYPGPGVGGHCIPVDPYYLSWIASKFKIKSNLIYHAGKVNSSMPKWILSKFKSFKDIKKILIVGVAYKKDLDDTRESPAVEFIKILRNKKIKVDYFDPFVKQLKSRKLFKTLNSIKLSASKLKEYSCVIIITNHSNINYNLIKKYSKLIIDTRDIYKKKSNKILKL
tara:strand:+ start:2806 stop:4083 length:1278 start_codon:yes stop_codon:yes gene_type:complete